MTATQIDYYSRLGVTPSASSADITRAFRLLAMRYHPDRNKAPDAMRLFIEVREAFEILIDPRKRAVYDRMRGPGTDVVVHRHSEADARDYGHWRDEARSRAQRDSQMAYDDFAAWLKQLATKVGNGASVVGFIGMLAFGGVAFSFMAIAIGAYSRGSDSAMAVLFLGGCAVACFWAAGAAIKDTFAEMKR
jgi:curved DNA-binding protein CbpA